MDLNLGYTQDIIEEAKSRNIALNDLAYILATAYHETAHTMRPVEEAYWVKNADTWRKKNLRYYPWYGRGFVQLTWDYNYKKASEKLGIDLIKNPSLALDPKIASKILIVGMKEGWFTGKSIDDYIDNLDEDDKEDLREFSNARRTVNGVDKQAEIGKIALQYEVLLKTVGYADKSPEKPVQEVSKQIDIPVSENKTTSVWPLIIKIILALFSKDKK